MKSNQIAPVLSEKSFAMANAHNRYMFNTNMELSKLEIKKLIEDQFGVKVISVNTSVRGGKMKRNFRNNKLFRTVHLKKAVVQLKEGDKITEFFE